MRIAGFELPTFSVFSRDFTASIVVFLVAMPLCMGIAIASGVPPERGLITGIIGGLVVGAIAIVHLEIERILGDQREEQLVGVQADAAEHAARTHRREAGELVDDVSQVSGGDGHDASLTMSSATRNACIPPCQADHANPAGRHAPSLLSFCGMTTIIQTPATGRTRRLPCVSSTRRP